MARGWEASPAVVERWKRERPGLIVDEADVPPYELPDPLLTTDGTRVDSPEAWLPRRQEILELFRAHVYGRRPSEPPAEAGQRQTFEVAEDDPSAMDGAATLKRITVTTARPGRSHQFEILLFVPNDSGRAAPVFLLLNNGRAEQTDPTRHHRFEFWPAEQVIARGYGIAAVQVHDLAPDDPQTFRNGIIGLYEADKRAESRASDAWAALSAWGWGASRAMDYFETDPRVDSSKVAVLGHSRGGKAALWAGAEDERFALVISNNSGCCGAALSRRTFGERIADPGILQRFPHWFCDNLKQYDGAEHALPVDQHMLISLLAPRAVYVASADEDLWADPRGEFLALAHASPVYALWNHAPIQPDDMPPLNHPLVAGPRGYHVRSGGHDLTARDWAWFLDFADTLWPPHDA